MHKRIPVLLVIGYIKPVRLVPDLFWYLADKRGALARRAKLENVILLFVVINALTMAMEHTRDSTVGLLWGEHCVTTVSSCPGDKRHIFYTMCLQTVNISCIFVFSLEMFIKVAGLWLKPYFSNPWNVLDCFLMIVSIVELPLLLLFMICLMKENISVNNCEEAGSGLSVLRMLRLLRLARFLRNVPNINRLFAVLSKTLFSLMNLGILFFILIIVFTSVGSFMYGGQMIEQPTRNNLFRGALVWIWGPSLPDQVTNIYPGVPARITTVDLKNHPDRPLGVELLTSFGNSKRIRGHIWTALSYEETGDNDATRRNRKGAREREAGDREQGHMRKLMAEKDSSGWEQDLNFEQGRIVFVCPRQNFANSENGMLAILQILMLEGWTDIFERGVEVSGLLMSAAFFGVVLLVGRYMTGSLAIASVIIGWREHSSGQFAIIRAEAVRDYRVKLLKEQYKDRIIRQSIAAEKHRRQVTPETTKLLSAHTVTSCKF